MGNPLGFRLRDEDQEEFLEIVNQEGMSVSSLTAKIVHDWIRFRRSKQEIDITIKENYGLDSGNLKQFTSLGASYQLTGTVIYTLSSKTGHIRRFFAGKLTFSTKFSESKRIIKPYS